MILGQMRITLVMQCLNILTRREPDRECDFELVSDGLRFA